MAAQGKCLGVSTAALASERLADSLTRCCSTHRVTTACSCPWSVAVTPRRPGSADPAFTMVSARDEVVTGALALVNA